MSTGWYSSDPTPRRTRATLRQEGRVNDWRSPQAESTTLALNGPPPQPSSYFLQLQKQLKRGSSDWHVNLQELLRGRSCCTELLDLLVMAVQFNNFTFVQAVLRYPDKLPKLFHVNDEGLHKALFRAALTDVGLRPNDRIRWMQVLLGLGCSPRALCADLLEHASPAVLHFIEKARVEEGILCQDTYKKTIFPIADQVGVQELAFARELLVELVGQPAALHSLVTALNVWTSKLAGQQSRQKPPSFAFAGPSGTGKTSLAHALSRLFGSSHFHKADCSKHTTSFELFGGGGAWRGSEQGSELNNFVVRQQGRPAVVLVDELDKADAEVRQQFLTVLDEGIWTDKRLQHKAQAASRDVPCHKILWIFTINKLDPVVLQKTDGWRKLLKPYYEPTQASTARQRLRVLSDVAKQMDSELRAELGKVFEPWFTGRVDRILAFLPLWSAQNRAPGTARDLQAEMASVLDMQLNETLAELRSGRWRPQADRAESLKVAFVDDQARHDFIRLAELRAPPQEGVRGLQRQVAQFLDDPVRENYMYYHVGSTVAICNGAVSVEPLDQEEDGSEAEECSSS